MSSDRLDPVKALARQNTVVGVSVALTAISVIIVACRVYTRTRILRNMGKDDWAMIAALIFTLAYLAMLLVLRENGMGFSGAVLSVPQMTKTLKVIIAIEIAYYLCVNAVKISIVFFYLRIAVEKTFARLCKGTIAFLATFCTVCIIVCVTQCIPLHMIWDFTGVVQGHCIDSTAFFYMTSSTNIVIDLWIIALPVKVVWSIQRPRREKYALVGIFALGVFSCIASIIRLYSVRIYTTSKDPFYDSVPINTWSMVEVNLGIWCASIPLLKSLFNKAQRERTRTTGYQYHSSGRSQNPGSEFGSRRTGTGTLTITKKEEFKMEAVIYTEQDRRKQGQVVGPWSPNDSDEEIVVSEHRV